MRNLIYVIYFATSLALSNSIQASPLPSNNLPTHPQGGTLNVPQPQSGYMQMRPPVGGILPSNQNNFKQGIDNFFKPQVAPSLPINDSSTNDALSLIHI